MSTGEQHGLFLPPYGTTATQVNTGVYDQAARDRDEQSAYVGIAPVLWAVALGFVLCTLAGWQHFVSSPLSVSTFLAPTLCAILQVVTFYALGRAYLVVAPVFFLVLLHIWQSSLSVGSADILTPPVSPALVSLLGTTAMIAVLARLALDWDP